MHQDSSSLDNATTAILRERLNILSSKPFAELAELPRHSSEEIVLRGTKLIIGVWHDVLVSQDHLIAVQVYRPGMLGIGGRMSADGFVVNSHNERRGLTVEEWAPFS